MSRTPSIIVPDQTPPAEDQPAKRKNGAALPFDLTRPEFDRLTAAMLTMVRSVGCPSHIAPLEVVQDALITGLSKPITERPSTSKWNEFVAWMCEVTKYAALTNIKSKHRVLLSAGHSDAVLGELLAVADGSAALESRELLQHALLSVEPADQALLVAVHLEGKTIVDLARERGLAPTTLDSRYRKILATLRACMQASFVAAVLFFSKKARAALAPLGHAGALVTVTGVCGALLPTSSSAAMDLSEPERLSSSDGGPQTAEVVALSVPEVEPEKPKELDEAPARCLDGPMKFSQVLTKVQKTVVPLALVVAPAVTQVGCAGAGQTPEKADEVDTEDHDFNYELYCQMKQRYGETPVSRADWDKGLR